MPSAPPLIETDLQELIERFHAAVDDRAAAFSAVSSVIKKLITAEQFEEAAHAVRRTTTPRLDYTNIQSLIRHLNRLLPVTGAVRHRLAVLSSSTSHQLLDMIRLFAFADEIDLEVYEGDFGTVRQEIIDPGSGLYAFAPETIFIATSWRDLTNIPDVADDAQRVTQLVQMEAAEWEKLWQTAHDRLGCQIIQNNFDHPSWQQLGNHERRHSGSLGRFITLVNQTFQESASVFVTIHDLDTLSSTIGRRAWGDERYYHHAKLPCSPEHLVEYAHSISSLLIAQLGRSRKCLILDLDNTLWGGVIGDDGLGGIRLGQGDAEGEAFLSFQRYTRKLRERGVILAVCSKNTDAIAREVFTAHPEMALKLEDISCFVANWEDKAANIRSIAKQLNIGLNSMVFIDDNPAERAIIRKLVPEVAVPEVTGDPLDFISTLEERRYFQTVLLASEDLRRTEFYRGNIDRQAVATSAQSIEGFLESLAMVATVGSITNTTLDRSTQLINKSNQFNLTTIRRSNAEVLAIVKDPNWITQTVSLKDKFGDNGLISVLLGKIDGDVLEIDTWVMSCRVLKRNVEFLLLDRICRLAGARGIGRLRGQYIPTAKNELVKNHYNALGFTQTKSDADGRTYYELEVSALETRQTFIEEKEAG